MRYSSHGLIIYQTASRVVVFRPFGKYILFSNLELALETLFRPLSDDRQLNLVSVSEDDTVITESDTITIAGVA